MGAAGAGGPIARGRDADVYAQGDGRVLRRYRRPGPTGRERRVMAHARAHGYPVPRVYQWTSTDMVMDRLDGPSMLADLVRQPWRLVRHARTLAELHRRLHAMDREAAARWPWARRLRLGVVRTNDQVLGFWRRMGFTETGEVRPWRYHRLESEVLLMDRPVP